MDSTHKVEYNLRSLTTRSVTLFPSHAQVFRDVPKVPLQPGTNEITIFGLTPTVDEDSIKVEGSGSAIIADIAVESLPNRDIFEEIYPDSDEDKSSDDEDSEEEEPECPPGPDLKAARAARDKLLDQLKEADEQVDNAKRRKVVLDGYASTLSCEHGVDIEDSIEAYKATREGVARDALVGQQRQREINELLADAEKEVKRLEKLHRKEKKRVTKEWKKSLLAKTKSKIKEARREDERLAEKERVQNERKKFWPKYCYAVKITLEANSFTPTSSRRNSVSSDIEMVGEKPSPPSEAQGTCDLVLSYVTSSAYWSPSYDLQLSTSSENGTLCFDAQLNNTTSETWEKCKITLSTSQTTSSGLQDIVPTLVPWRLKLNKASHPDDTTALMSAEEKSHKNKGKGALKGAAGKSRGAMFGVNNSSNHKLSDYQTQLMLLEEQNKKRLMMARQEQGNGSNSNMNNTSFGASANVAPSLPQQQQPQQYAAQRQAMAQQQMQQQQQQQQEPQATYAPQSLDFDTLLSGDQTIEVSFDHTEKKEALDFQESLVEESGFTTTYEIPGSKTLVPKSNTTKQRIARISFANVVFSHTVVAKYKPVAHLAAKLQNMSKLTLLRGPVGVTLDGSFMGRTTLPRCGAGGEFISLSLGVDPAIRVVYAQPEVRRATTGYFSNEEIKIYTRIIRIENTRTSTNSKHTKLLVRDQVPVSSVDKLRVELLKPEGLVPEGEKKEAGEAGRDKDKDGWGTADAKLHKDGQVTWLVALRAGKSVKLGLEYLVGTPIGDHAVQAF